MHLRSTHQNWRIDERIHSGVNNLNNLLFLFRGRELECVRGRKWVREMLKALHFIILLLSLPLRPSKHYKQKGLRALKCKNLPVYQWNQLLLCTPNLSYKSKSRKCLTCRSKIDLKWASELQVKGQSYPGSLSQEEIHPGTSYRSCQSGGYRRTVEPAPHLGCYPAASQSTSTHFLPWMHTELCNRCWSEERGVFSYVFREVTLHWVMDNGILGGECWKRLYGHTKKITTDLKNVCTEMERKFKQKWEMSGMILSDSKMGGTKDNHVWIETE